jgi:Ca2+-binding EF-hand superfamily protein
MGGSIVEKMAWASDIFEELSFMLGIEMTQFEQFFQTYDGKMDTNEFMRKFASLAIVLPNDALKKFLDDLTDYQSGKININALKECVTFYNRQPKRNPQDMGMAHLDSIKVEILTALTQSRLDFNSAFSMLDRSRIGTCPKPDLQTYLINNLRINNTANIRVLFSQIVNLQTGYIDLNKFNIVLQTPIIKQESRLGSGRPPLQHLGSTISDASLILEQLRRLLTKWE